MRALEKLASASELLGSTSKLLGSTNELLGSTSELLGSTSELLASIAMNVTCSSFLRACISKVLYVAVLASALVYNFYLPRTFYIWSIEAQAFKAR